MQVDLKQILSGLRKRWWLPLLVMLSAAAVAYGYSKTQPNVYQSHVTMVARPVPLDNGQIEAIKKTLNTYAQELGSPDFWQRVIDSELIRDVDVSSLQGKIHVQAMPDANAIAMTVDNRTAEIAQLLADRLSAAFVEQHNAENQDINPGGFRTVWIVTQPPELPAKPYQPRPNLYAGAAALFGLILGLLLAIILELLDTSLKTPAEVQSYLNMTTLGVIPKGN